MLGMVSGHISDSQISVWPEVERGWLPESARLLTGRTGWIVPLLHNSPWLGLDLGFPRYVSAIILQGGRHKEKNMFIRKFKLGYSTDGAEWNYLLEKKSNKSKVRKRWFLSDMLVSCVTSSHWFEWRHANSLSLVRSGTSCSIKLKLHSQTDHIGSKTARRLPSVLDGFCYIWPDSRSK